MSSFDDEFDAMAAEALMDEFGESATYHPYSGDDVPLTVLASEELTEERQEGDRLVNYRARMCLISTNPSSQWGGVASPDVRATLTLGVKYSIEAVQEADGSFVDLKLARPELAEVARPQYRGRRY